MHAEHHCDHVPATTAPTLAHGVTLASSRINADFLDDGYVAQPLPEAVFGIELAMKQSPVLLLHLGKSVFGLFDRNVCGIASNIQLYLPRLLPLAQITTLSTPDIKDLEIPLVANELLDDGRLDPVVEAAQSLDLAVCVAPFTTSLRDRVVMLFDDVVDTSLCGLLLCPPSRFFFSRLRTLSGGFAVRG